jgi:hypothetical protein
MRDISQVEVTIFHLLSTEEGIPTYLSHSSLAERQNLLSCGLCPYSRPNREENSIYFVTYCFGV